MKDKEILIKARKLIENGKHEFICHAICEAIYGDGWGTQWFVEVAQHPLFDWVNSMIGSGNTYYAWLNDGNYNPPNNKLCNTGRLQWLDWMINYCAIEEDFGKIIEVKKYTDTNNIDCY